jgi:hypothetical protein
VKKPSMKKEESVKAVAAELLEVAGFAANPEQLALKAKLLVASREDEGVPLSTLNSHEAVESAAKAPVPKEWTGNALFMSWLRDEGEGAAKAELLFQRCMDRALEIVSDVTLSDKDLAALLKISAELSGRTVGKGARPSALTLPAAGRKALPAANKDELKEQLHAWALSEGYTPPNK